MYSGKIFYSKFFFMTIKTQSMNAQDLNLDPILQCVTFWESYSMDLFWDIRSNNPRDVVSKIKVTTGLCEHDEYRPCIIINSILKGLFCLKLLLFKKYEF